MRFNKQKKSKGINSKEKKYKIIEDSRDIIHNEESIGEEKNYITDNQDKITIFGNNIQYKKNINNKGFEYGDLIGKRKNYNLYISGVENVSDNKFFFNSNNTNNDIIKSKIRICKNNNSIKKFSYLYTPYKTKISPSKIRYKGIYKNEKSDYFKVYKIYINDSNIHNTYHNSDNLNYTNNFYTEIKNDKEKRIHFYKKKTILFEEK